MPAGGYMEKKHNPELTPRARELRKSMTKQERRLWYQYLRKFPVRFLRQKVIGWFIVDFYCAAAKLVIELDGSQHFDGSAIAYDNERTEVLRAYGLDVIRFTNYEVDRYFPEVCEKIQSEVLQRMNPSNGR